MANATVNNRKQKLIYRTSTGLYYSHVNPHTGKLGQYGADVYDVEGDENHVVLFATSGRTGSRLNNTKTVVTKERYESLADLHDPYDNFPFHNAVMSEMGFM